MSVVINISKTYRKPIQTYSRLFELGASEKQNLAFLIGGCVISFVSQWPVQARYAFANQQSIDELMGAILLSNLFLLPLIFYFNLVGKSIEKNIKNISATTSNS